MQDLWWVCWFFWESLPALDAFPLSSPIVSGLGDVSEDTYVPGYHRWQWNWLRYTFGLLTITVTAFTIVGCLCCRRHRRPKGFQEKGEKCEQEFKDGNTTSRELTFENPVSGLELGVSTAAVHAERVHFEPLPLERFISDAKPKSQPKPPHPAPFATTPTKDGDQSIPFEPCREWLDKNDHHVPREKLKYLREIGRGWFGKVVEGRVDLESPDNALQNKGVIVRILTEEATTQEKSWFLGEATPYLKLRHRNILSLLGSCLETDPYLLLFESCPPGDLKAFLASNRDIQSRESLAQQKVPSRMATEVAAALLHMHAHGFAHTDLSARNCLVASDLSVKLGDYGIGIEKYPGDYYIVGDRALPIRWAAPESLKCTETTIETREITSKANLWSYAVLLWEIATWGDRPYDDYSDEEIIRMVLSPGDDRNLSESTSHRLLLKCPEDCADNLYQAMLQCWSLEPSERPSLDQVRQILLGTEDFELRWENLRPNALQEKQRSASLQSLHGSMDSDCWPAVNSSGDQELHVGSDDGSTARTSFRLGPGEPVKNVPGSRSNNTVPSESGSETEEESWRGRVERGAYTEKVRQKSKSVADLMVLVHIDSDSDADWSLGAQGPEKTRKRISTAGSDSNLRGTVLADEFDEALRQLRNTPNEHLDSFDFTSCQIMPDIDQSNSPDRTNLLTLTTDVEQRPMLRLLFPLDRPDSEPKEEVVTLTGIAGNVLNQSGNSLSKMEPLDRLGNNLGKEKDNGTLANEPEINVAASNTQIPLKGANLETGTAEEHILRLLPKEDPSAPLLRFAPETITFSGNFNDMNLKLDLASGDSKEGAIDREEVDVALWNQVLDSALEKKIPSELYEFTSDNVRQSDFNVAHAQSVMKVESVKNEDIERENMPQEQISVLYSNSAHKQKSPSELNEFTSDRNRQSDSSCALAQSAAKVTTEREEDSEKENTKVNTGKLDDSGEENISQERISVLSSNSAHKRNSSSELNEFASDGIWQSDSSCALAQSAAKVVTEELGDSREENMTQQRMSVLSSNSALKQKTPSELPESTNENVQRSESSGAHAQFATKVATGKNENSEQENTFQEEISVLSSDSALIQKSPSDLYESCSEKVEQSDHSGPLEQSITNVVIEQKQDSEKEKVFQGQVTLMSLDSVFKEKSPNELYEFTSEKVQQSDSSSHVQPAPKVATVKNEDCAKKNTSQDRISVLSSDSAVKQENPSESYEFMGENVQQSDSRSPHVQSETKVATEKNEESDKENTSPARISLLSSDATLEQKSPSELYEFTFDKVQQSNSIDVHAQSATKAVIGKSEDSEKENSSYEQISAPSTDSALKQQNLSELYEVPSAEQESEKGSQRRKSDSSCAYEQSPPKVVIGKKEDVQKENASQEQIMELLSSETLPWKVSEKREELQGGREDRRVMPPVTTASVPDTPSRTDDSIENVEDDSSHTEDFETEGKRPPQVLVEEGDDCKRLSTPDDERSSDSGFRDKESCEEEESPPPMSCLQRPALSTNEDDDEEEQLQVLSELDAILDAESFGTQADSESVGGELLSPDSIERKVTDLDDPDPDDFEQFYDHYPDAPGQTGWFLHPQDGQSQEKTEPSTNDVISSPGKSESLTQEHGNPVESQYSTSNSEDDTNTGNRRQAVDESQIDEIPTRNPRYMYPSDANDSEDENSSTASLRSDNSYVSFGLEEEFVAAIRNELREKLPRAQMPVEEAPEPHDAEDLVAYDNTGSNIVEHQTWEDENDEVAERGSGVVDISIRYNVYNAPLSPILEERESTVTSDSQISKDDSGEDAATTRELESHSDEHDQPEDLLLVDTRTNKAILLEGGRDGDELGETDDQDTFNVDISDDENFEYTMVPHNFVQSQANQSMVKTGSGAPLPSPEDELKWQQLPLPFAHSMQDDMISTSFGSTQDWDSHDEDDDDADGDNSSSSGEFVWKEGERQSPTHTRMDMSLQRHNDLGLEKIDEKGEGGQGSEVMDDDLEAEEDEEDDEEEEFTPSAWDATLAPHRSALRSPDKTQRPGDQKKSVWFKKQRYHCVYEYPKEAPSSNSLKQPPTVWEPTTYADWEEMMEEPRLDLYPLDYDVTDQPGEEEFYVSSSNRPFQFQTGDEEQVSQFFPGAASTLLQQQQQLGELRHTRDKLKLNLSSNGATAVTASPPKEDNEEKGMDQADHEVPKTLESSASLERQTVTDMRVSEGEEKMEGVTDCRIESPVGTQDYNSSCTRSALTIESE